MKVYGDLEIQNGVELKNVQIEEVTTLPAWTSADESRLLYETDTACLYYGTATGWMALKKGIYVHTQGGASDTWTIAHNLGTKDLIITVYDENDVVILADSITNTDTNTTVITFEDVQSGKAVLANTGLASQMMDVPWRGVRTMDELYDVLENEYPNGGINIFMYPGTYEPDHSISFIDKKNITLQASGDAIFDMSSYNDIVPFITNYSIIAQESADFTDANTGDPIGEGTLSIAVAEEAFYNACAVGDYLLLGSAWAGTNPNGLYRILTKTSNQPGEYWLGLEYAIKNTWGNFEGYNPPDKIQVINSLETTITTENIVFKGLTFINSALPPINLFGEGTILESCNFTLQGPTLIGVNCRIENCKFSAGDAVFLLQSSSIINCLLDVSTVTMTLTGCQVSGVSGEGTVSFVGSTQSSISGILMNDLANIDVYQTGGLSISSCSFGGIGSIDLCFGSKFTGVFFGNIGSVADIDYCEFVACTFDMVTARRLNATQFVFKGSLVSTCLFRHREEIEANIVLDGSHFSGNSFVPYPWVETMDPALYIVNLTSTNYSLVSDNQSIGMGFILSNDGTSRAENNTSANYIVDTSQIHLNVNLFPGITPVAKLLSVIEFVRTNIPYPFSVFCPSGDYIFNSEEGLDLRNINNFTLTGAGDSTTFIFTDGFDPGNTLSPYPSGILLGNTYSPFRYWYDGEDDYGEVPINNTPRVEGDISISVVAANLPPDFTPSPLDYIVISTDGGVKFATHIRSVVVGGHGTSFVLTLYDPLPATIESNGWTKIAHGESWSGTPGGSGSMNNTIENISLVGAGGSALIAANGVMGLKVRNVSLSGAVDYGVIFNGCRDVKIQDIQADNIGYCAIGAELSSIVEITNVSVDNAATGIEMYYVNKATIDNSITGFCPYSLYCEGVYFSSFNSLIDLPMHSGLGVPIVQISRYQDVSFSDCKLGQFDAANPTTAANKNLHITNCVFYDHVILASGGGVLIHHNIIGDDLDVQSTNFEEGGYGEDISIMDNTIKGDVYLLVTQPAPVVNFSFYDIKVHGNTLWNPVEIGLNTMPGGIITGVSICNNISYTQSTNAFIVNAASSVQISNNTIFSSAGDIAVFGAYDDNDLLLNADCFMSNNTGARNIYAKQINGVIKNNVVKNKIWVDSDADPVIGFTIDGNEINTSDGSIASGIIEVGNCDKGVVSNNIIRATNARYGIALLNTCTKAVLMNNLMALTIDDQGTDTFLNNNVESLSTWLPI